MSIRTVYCPIFNSPKTSILDKPKGAPSGKIIVCSKCAAAEIMTPHNSRWVYPETLGK